MADRKFAKRRTRDAAFQEKLLKYGLTTAPVLNVDDSAATITSADEDGSVERFKQLDRQVSLTIDHAAEYVQLPVFRGERDVSDAHAQFLLDEMTRKNFNWDLVTLARCEFQGQHYKINGQHTCWARIAARLAADPTVREIVYRVQDEGELRKIYRTFDRAKNRSDAHIMQVELLGKDIDPDISKAWASLVAAGVRMWRFGDIDTYKRVRPDQLATIIDGSDVKPIFTVVALFCQSRSKDSHTLIKRQPVIAAMMETFSRDTQAAITFWTDISEATNLTKGDPRWMLYNYLKKSVLNIAGRSPGSGDRQVVRTEDMYRVCVHLWNKWRAGETVANVRSPASRPKAI
jgi:hypothetical protein